jgi:hypothetical protein
MLKNFFQLLKMLLVVMGKFPGIYFWEFPGEIPNIGNFPGI